MSQSVPAGVGADHVHDGEDEMFYLLGGEMEVFCGKDRWTVGAGSFVFVPRDPARLHQPGPRHARGAPARPS